MSAIGALRQLEKEKNKDPSKGGFKVRMLICLCVYRLLFFLCFAL